MTATVPFHDSNLDVDLEADSRGLATAARTLLHFGADRQKERPYAMRAGCISRRETHRALLI